MMKRILITTILAVLLVGIPYLILRNFKQSSDRGKELTNEFKKLESSRIESIKLTIRNSLDSVIVDSIIVDKEFCERLRNEFMNLPHTPGPSSRLITRKEVDMDIMTTSKEHLNIELYLTDITALVLIKTKSKDWVEGLDDLYSSTDLKKIFENI